MFPQTWKPYLSRDLTEIGTQSNYTAIQNFQVLIKLLLRCDLEFIEGQ